MDQLEYYRLMQQQAMMQQQYGGLGSLLGAASIGNTAPAPAKNVQPEPDKALLLLEEEDAVETV